MSSKDGRLALLGARIKKLRKSRGFSQIKLAIILEITREHLSKIERGVTPPSFKLLFSIADTLGVRVVELIEF